MARVVLTTPTLDDEDEFLDANHASRAFHRPWSYNPLTPDAYRTYLFALGDRKVSGNAQLRGRYGLLHQGTLLTACDVDLLSRVLREPPRQPDYRKRRRHADFLGFLPLDAAAIRSRLVRAFI